MWNETCEFEIFNPYFALIRFLVQDEDMFGDSNFIGQATYPVSTLLNVLHLCILSNKAFLFDFFLIQKKIILIFLGALFKNGI